MPGTGGVIHVKHSTGLTLDQALVAAQGLLTQGPPA